MNQEVAEVKTFKDPIYGYIEIENALIAGVVDTAVFQRLRDCGSDELYTLVFFSCPHSFCAFLRCVLFGKDGFWCISEIFQGNFSGRKF